ncbi:MAG: hypothetical protein KAH48_07140, partial [Chlorobi bacterium]|nr:hypothetical protein [Chlorobiota bacterium]
MKTTAYILVLILLMIFQSSIMNAEQKIYTINNDISEYPIVKTYYYAFDAVDDLILNINKTDIAITDNGLNVNIIDSDNPDDNAEDALSLVLAFDLGVKDSEEDDSNFKLAQKVAEKIVELFPFGSSECALTGFDQFSYLFNEFSADPQGFTALIAGFQYGGNSNYTTGLASVPIGAIRIAQHGKHQRAVAVITDGKALADAAK